MANEWNISYPLDHTLISDVPTEIRKLKNSCKDQLDMEHETPQDGDATGSEHSSGSAVAYEGSSTPTNRPDGATALADNAIDRGRIWLDDNFDPPLLKRWTGSAFEVVGPSLSAYTNEDSDGNAMLKTHAYLAATDGFVTAYVTVTAGATNIQGFVGSTDNPAGEGTLIRRDDDSTAGTVHGISFLVSKGEYFELTSPATGAITIYWKSFGALSKPVDQEA